MRTLEFDDATLDLLDRIAAVAGTLWERGWAERNAGNISLRLLASFSSRKSDRAGSPLHPLEKPLPNIGGCHFLVSGAGTRMRELGQKALKRVCLVRISDHGSSYRVVRGRFEDGYQPTSEFPSHLLVHNYLKGTGRDEIIILHTHPTELIALTHIPEYNSEEKLNQLLWSMHPEVKVVIPEGAGLVPYVLPGSTELARATVASLEERRIVLWSKHGCLAVAPDPETALDLIDTLNKSARIFLACRAAGFEPEGLSREQLAELERKFPRLEL